MQGVKYINPKYYIRSCKNPIPLFTTGAPARTCITAEEAKTIARIFVHHFEDDPQFLDPRLVSLKPEKNPCGLDELDTNFKVDGRSSCWRVIINSPYCD